MEEGEGFGQRRRGFSGRGDAGGFAPKPVEVGEEHEVDIQELSQRGEGIARIQGLVIFVPNTKQGEHVKIRITRISRRFAEAETVGNAEPQSRKEKAE